jgi:hypothetical protein
MPQFLSRAKEMFYIEFHSIFKLKFIYLFFKLYF